MKVSVRHMGIKGQGHLYGALDSGDGICARPECGWHAELGPDGFCLTPECKQARITEALQRGNGLVQRDGKGNRTVIVKL